VHASRPPHGRVATLLLVPAALALTVLSLAVAPAQADAFRFWGYFQWDAAGSTWTFAQTGPDQSTPADGTVEGWRFAVADEASTKAPRVAGDFAAICGSDPAPAGQKRVAVVLDYGTPADAESGEPPAARGECAVVDEAATGSQVLASVATTRVAEGLVCGIDGWPASGCGDPVPGAAPADPTGEVVLALPDAPVTEEAAAGTEPAASEGADDGGGFPWLLAAGVVAVGGVGAAAWARSRREDRRAA
jgi:hypothetical protein